MLWSGDKVFKKCILPLLNQGHIGNITSNGVMVDGLRMKINPNGVDMPIGEIAFVPEKAQAVICGDERAFMEPYLPIVQKPVLKYYHLYRGTYIAKLRYPLKIPVCAAGECILRSSFVRLGSETPPNMYDTGYEGIGTHQVRVHIDQLHVHQNEAWFQFIVRDAEESKLTYKGHYQHEGMIRR